MVENDIYNNEKKYLKFKNDYTTLAVPNFNKMRKYYCRNKENLKHFQRLFNHFEANDISYVRRMRLIESFKVILFVTEKLLEECTRDDINQIVAYAYSNFKSAKTVSDFKTDLKFMWKLILPDPDIYGRPDETMTPYVVRHLTSKVDKSRQTERKDKLGNNPLEIHRNFQKLVASFHAETHMQAYLMLVWDSLARPQEILYLKRGNVHLRDGYADIFLTEHGKEGIKRIQCFDSFPYIVEWLNRHPLKDDDAFLFVNTRDMKQLKPVTINKKIRTKLKQLNINIPITSYSIKRNGITYLDILGVPATDIQHRAGWTSTKQLQIYSKKDQDVAFKKRLADAGKLSDYEAQKYKQSVDLTQKCSSCGTLNKFTDEYCSSCRNPLFLDIGRSSKEYNVMKESFELLKNIMHKPNAIQELELAQKFQQFYKTEKTVYN